jgi:hypothetical protein
VSAVVWDLLASVLWFGAFLTCVGVLVRYARRSRADRRSRDHGLDVIKDLQDVT